MTAPKTVLGGDEIRAVVADCGSWSLRFGSSGNDTPRAIIPSAVAHRHPSYAKDLKDVEMTDIQTENAGQKPVPISPKPETSFLSESVGKPSAGDIVVTAPTRFRDVQPLFSFANDGSVSIPDWDAMQVAWKAGYKHLGLPVDMPLLLVESTRPWSQETRAKALECAFEGLGVPASFLARGSVMTAFASARTTATVLDIGYQGACAVPIVDGYVLKNQVVGSCVGGRFLSEKLRAWSEDILDTRTGYDGVERRAKRLRDSEMKRVDWLRAHHELKKERIPSDDTIRRYKVTDMSGEKPLVDCTDRHRLFYRLRIMDEFRRAALQIPLETSDNGDLESKEANDGKEAAAKPKSDAEKEKESNGRDGKDGNVKEAGGKGKDRGTAERSDEYELPDGNILSLKENHGSSIANLLFTNKEDVGMMSMSDLVFASASGCDVDLRRDLFGGVVISGGTSTIPGVVERVTRELGLMIPQAYKLRVIAPANSVERTCAAWIGGAIISNLGTFHQSWVSKQDYEELGSMGALRKCP